MIDVINLFPTPIYTSSIDVNDVNADHVLCSPNGSQEEVMLSDSDFLLNDASFSGLKSKIDMHMNHFFYNVLGYDECMYPEMTTSWLVKSMHGQSSSLHVHANAIFSGVLYLYAPKNCGNISFSLKEYDDRNVINAIQPPVKFRTQYNIGEYSITPKNGLLLIFAASLRHRVMTNQSKENRLSIAFNYFLKGKIKVKAASLEIK
jgi:uncharacterized protein (TIGR02466 family)